MRRRGADSADSPSSGSKYLSRIWSARLCGIPQAECVRARIAGECIGAIPQAATSGVLMGHHSCLERDVPLQDPADLAVLCEALQIVSRGLGDPG